MSKAEILHELPKLGLQEPREIFERVVQLEVEDLLKGGDPLAADKVLRDREPEEYRRNPEAGSTGPEVASSLRKPTRS